MEPLALAGLLALLLVKEAGVPVPVPGDLLVIGAGAALASSGPGALVGLALILAAGYAGGTFQFALMRRVRRPLLALLARVGVSPARLEALAGRLRRSGARGVAVARMTPGVRVGAIAASGLAELPTGMFVRGLVVGNTVFVAGHYALGYALGASAGQLITEAGSALLPVAAGVGVLSVLGAVGWAMLRRVRRATSGLASVGTWADAACPACLALAVVGRPGQTPTQP
jgi:membrane protein DedA with SNARE-associated domain